MNRKHVVFHFLYWVLALTPLLMTFWVFFLIPTVFEIAPNLSFATRREAIWILPVFTFLFAITFYFLSRKTALHLEEKANSQGKTTDISQVLPAVRLYIMVSLSSLSLSSLHSFYVETQGIMGSSLTNHIFIVILAIGLLLLGKSFQDASPTHFLALHFSYTQNCQKVWGKTHALATKLFPLTGFVLLFSLVFLEAFLLIAFGLFCLTALLLFLYLYAKHLYESDFYQ